MNAEEKLAILGAAAKYDICASSCAKSSPPITNNRIGDLNAGGICHSYTPDGRCVSLLKVLMTNSCRNDCHYCVNRRSNDFNRTSFQSEELARLFMEMYKRNYVEGLFLSSGVKENTTKTMEEMIKTVEILRFNYRYHGYIHLKILPNTSEDLVKRSAKLATRLSINLEAPNPKRLSSIAGEKDFMKDLIGTMSFIQKEADKGLLKGGHTTQFVVGASGESDSEILKTTNWLYKTKSLKRAYFSAFIPQEKKEGEPSSLVNIPSAPPLLREHRLYQTDWLLRVYKFSLDEIALDSDGNLFLDIDPKVAYAIKNRDKFPVEINKASFDELLRVPGIGVQSARRIWMARKSYRFTEPKELKNLGVTTKRALPFLTINGKLHSRVEKLFSVKQLSLFDRKLTSAHEEGMMVLNG